MGLHLRKRWSCTDGFLFGRPFVPNWRRRDGGCGNCQIGKVSGAFAAIILLLQLAVFGLGGGD